MISDEQVEAALHVLYGAHPYEWFTPTERATMRRVLEEYKKSEFDALAKSFGWFSKPKPKPSRTVKVTIPEIVLEVPMEEGTV